LGDFEQCNGNICVIAHATNYATKDRGHHLGDERGMIKKKKDKFKSLSSFLRRKATFVASSSSQIFQYVVVYILGDFKVFKDLRKKKETRKTPKRLIQN
jgi:hypothetical protein